jgi:hypothetical protein
MKWFLRETHFLWKTVVSLGIKSYQKIPNYGSWGTKIKCFQKLI